MLVRAGRLFMVLRLFLICTANRPRLFDDLGNGHEGGVQALRAHAVQERLWGLRDYWTCCGDRGVYDLIQQDSSLSVLCDLKT